MLRAACPRVDGALPGGQELESQRGTELLFVEFCFAALIDWMFAVGHEPQLMDFNLAKRINNDSVMTTGRSLLGTLSYMVPEQARKSSARK